MNHNRICLFTAHTPLIGGGGVILRSLIAGLPEIPVLWTYIADEPVPGYEEGYLGRGFMGGSVGQDMWQSWRMMAGKSSDGIDRIVGQLLAVDCDQYWIVSHNEGLRLALELTRVQTERPVHLTVHDDWAGALSARSVRYRLLAGLAQTMTAATLKRVHSFDVISRGMQAAYEKLSGRTGAICHRYLPPEAVSDQLEYQPDPAEISVGHIGSIYDRTDFFAFADLVRTYADSTNKSAVIHMWGFRLTDNEVPQALRPVIRFHGDLPEEQVIPKLARCSFVYAMYPMTSRLRRFSQTSLPTKLTSYVQAGRPILGHGPADSSLAEFLRTTQTGVLWSSLDADAGRQAIRQVLAQPTDPTRRQRARDLYFGESNLAVMRQVFEPTPLSIHP